MDKKRASDRAYYKKHRDGLIAYQLQWSRDNRNKRKRYCDKWYKRNPDRVRANRRRGLMHTIRFKFYSDGQEVTIRCKPPRCFWPILYKLNEIRRTIPGGK